MNNEINWQLPIEIEFNGVWYPAVTGYVGPTRVVARQGYESGVRMFYEVDGMEPNVRNVVPSPAAEGADPANPVEGVTLRQKGDDVDGFLREIDIDGVYAGRDIASDGRLNPSHSGAPLKGWNTPNTNPAFARHTLVLTELRDRVRAERLAAKPAARWDVVRTPGGREVRLWNLHGGEKQPVCWATVGQDRTFTIGESGEVADVCIMRPTDLETSGRIWFYRPRKHKTQHLGKARLIAIGPRAQEYLKPFLARRMNVTTPIFSPREAFIEGCEKRRQAFDASERKGDYRRAASYQARERKGRGGEEFDRTLYARHIARACEAAKIDAWSPGQLRHNAATSIRKRFGLEFAQAVLGHSKADTTEIYAQIGIDRAVEAMEAVG